MHGEPLCYYITDTNETSELYYDYIPPVSVLSYPRTLSHKARDALIVICSSSCGTHLDATSGVVQTGVAYTLLLSCM